MRKILDPKDPSEKVNVVFDFTDALAGDTISGSPTVTATVDAGTDATPSAILNGAAGVVGATVVQSVQDGVVGVDYRIEAQIDTTGSSPARRLVLAAILPVRDA